MSVEILVGNIASGKSTYARERARQGALIICRDDIITFLHGGLYTGYEPKFKGDLYDVIFNAALIAAIKTTADVVIDSRNHTEAKRRHLLAVIDKNGSPNVACTVFEREDPAVHAQRRLVADNRGIPYEQWLNVAIATDSEWEEPNGIEGFVNITHMATRCLGDVEMVTERTE